MKTTTIIMGQANRESGRRYPMAEMVSKDNGDNWKVRCRRERGMPECPALICNGLDQGAVFGRRSGVTEVNCGAECGLVRRNATI